MAQCQTLTLEEGLLKSPAHQVLLERDLVHHVHYSPAEHPFLLRGTSKAIPRLESSSSVLRGRRLEVPLSSEVGTYKTVKARSWPWLSGKGSQNLLSFASWRGSGTPRSPRSTPPRSQHARALQGSTTPEPFKCLPKVDFPQGLGDPKGRNRQGTVSKRATTLQQSGVTMQNAHAR